LLKLNATMSPFVGVGSPHDLWGRKAPPTTRGYNHPPGGDLNSFRFACACALPDRPLRAALYPVYFPEHDAGILSYE